MLPTDGRRLADRFDVWALDFRGHGATAAAAEAAVEWRRYGDDARAAARWLAERSGRPLSAFGHSMGGAALLMVALDEPGLIERIVAYEPIVLPPTRSIRSARPTRSTGRAEPAGRRGPTPARRVPSAAAALDNFASKPPMRRSTRPPCTSTSTGGVAPVDADDPDGPVRLCCPPEYEAATFVAAVDHDVWDRLGEVTVPVTVVAGSEAGDDPALLAPRVAERIPGGRYESHPELDHFGPFVDPPAVARLSTGRRRPVMTAPDRRPSPRAEMCTFRWHMLGRRPSPSAHHRAQALDTPASYDGGVFDVPTSLSPSRVESFTSCPLAFRFTSIERLDDPPTVHTTRGSLVHRALQLAFTAPPGSRDRDVFARPPSGRSKSSASCPTSRSRPRRRRAAALEESGRGSSSATSRWRIPTRCGRSDSSCG